jgi:hypothetical protein
MASPKGEAPSPEGEAPSPEGEAPLPGGEALPRIFVFNGDYVDRGAWGLETLLLLLAWKVNFPAPSYWHKLII